LGTKRMLSQKNLTNDCIFSGIFSQGFLIKTALSPQYHCDYLMKYNKAFAIFMATTITIYTSVIVLPTVAFAEPSVGLKEGDWIEYTFSVTGPPLDPLRNLTWYRMDIIEVNGASFQVNKTALSVNGLLSSSVWTFNLAEGKVWGWVIIPANLSSGDTFFDVSKSDNITIEGEVEKTLLGASRTVTFGNDPERVYREWDKATGVYVHAIEHTTDYTVVTNAEATNMWASSSPQQNETVPYMLIAGVTLLLAMPLVFLFFYKKMLQNSAKRWHILLFDVTLKKVFLYSLIY